MKNLFPSDPAAFLQCTLEIILYITYYLILIHEGCALKMMVQASEIQINTAKWCKQNCPEEVIFENGTEIEITISGRMQFLNSIQ